MHLGLNRSDVRLHVVLEPAHNSCLRDNIASHRAGLRIQALATRLADRYSPEMSSVTRYRP